MLGQRKSLINSITPISKHQLSGKTTQTHYTGKQNSTHQGCLTPRMVWAVGLFPGSFPDVADPTDADAGRTDVSVDPARRKVRTPSGRPLMATATATATSLDCAPAVSPAAPTTTASARLRYQPTVSVPDFVSANRSSNAPAVAYDGDLDVSRRTLATGLVRRADAAPCVLRATANWNRSSQLTVAAALTTRNSTSPNQSLRLSALYFSAHCRALSQHAEHMRRLHTLFVARLFYSCLTLQQTCVLNAV